jgi:hypothetical protein
MTNHEINYFLDELNTEELFEQERQRTLVHLEDLRAELTKVIMSLDRQISEMNVKSKKIW